MVEEPLAPGASNLFQEQGDQKSEMELFQEQGDQRSKMELFQEQVTCSRSK